MEAHWRSEVEVGSYGSLPFSGFIAISESVAYPVSGGRGCSELARGTEDALSSVLAFGAEVVGPVNRLVDHAGGGRRREIKRDPGRGYCRCVYCEQKELGKHTSSLEPGSRGLEPEQNNKTDAVSFRERWVHKS